MGIDTIIMTSYTVTEEMIKEECKKLKVPFDKLTKDEIQDLKFVAEYRVNEGGESETIEKLEGFGEIDYNVSILFATIDYYKGNNRFQYQEFD